MPEQSDSRCDECKNELRICRLEESEKNNRETHGRIFDRLEESKVGYTRIDVKIETIFKTLDEMARDIKSLKERDSKRWDSVVTTLIVAGVSGAVGYFISMLR